MNSAPFVMNEVRWSDSEKKVARKAFNSALHRQCASIMSTVKRMASKASSPTDLWNIHDYLSRQRKRVDAVYDYRYSRLLDVFTTLLHDGWLQEEDLAGISEDKIAKIRLWAGRQSGLPPMRRLRQTVTTNPDSSHKQA